MNTRAAPQWSLVTGASSGIGEALARVLAANGSNLVITARRVERLNRLREELESAHKREVLVVPMDLARPDSALELYEATQALGVEIDTLVNNAGYGMAGTFADIPWDEHAAFMQVMAVTPARLAHLYLRPMQKRGHGRILNMASFSSFFPGSPYLGLYAPLKHFVLAMSQAMAVETAGSGVTVTAVCPGPTETDWIEMTGTRGFVNALPGFMLMTPRDVAEIAHAGMLAGTRCVVPGVANKVAVSLARHLPPSLFLWALKRIFG